MTEWIKDRWNSFLTLLVLTPEKSLLINLTLLLFKILSSLLPDTQSKNDIVPGNNGK